MYKRCFEINGNLFNDDNGLKNSKDFLEVIVSVKNIYDRIFSQEIMDRYDLYVDNATEDSGYTPITTIILQKYVIIKLGISINSSRSTIAFQFAHELTHFVFCSCFGLNKPRTSYMEEIICTAASLIVIRMLFPTEFEWWDNYVRCLDKEYYKQGADYAEQLEYNLENLKNNIIDFKY